MEKDHRLFVRNLPVDIDDEKLQKLFENHGKITNIDVKEKIQNDGSRIAFVNLTTNDRQLNTCFQAVNGKVLNGNAIRVEVAKESFLDRLKREREEAANRKEPAKEPTVSSDRHIERINIKAPANVKIKPTKRIYNFDDDNDESTKKCEEETGNARTFDYDPALRVEEEPVEERVEKRERKEKQLPPKYEPIVPKAPEKKVISESEMKRLASVKQKRQAFRAKEQLISHALKAVDSGRNKKIVFSEDIDKIGGAGDKRSKSLFDDDEDDDEQGDWNDDRFKHDEKRSAKLAMSMNNLGRDKRFAIDERFLDDEEIPSKTKTNENDEDDNEMKNETQWQLDILQNVLGKPLKSREQILQSKKQNRMVRYDPTASDHQIHEVETTSKPATKVKRTKHMAKETKTEEEIPIPVSSEVFYSVSDNLADTLKGQEEFSLLKTFGTAAPTDKNRSDDYDAAAYVNRDNQEGNFDARNPFKYESSDDEGPDPTYDQMTRNDDDNARGKMNNRSNERNDSFFFASGDQRFGDAEEFFKTKTTDSDNFNNVRRELKMIVRKKVRNNVKKSTPWRNKKIGRTPKSR